VAAGAGLDIGPGDVGGDADPGQVQGRLAGLGVGMGGLGGALDPADQVDLVGDLDPDIGQVLDRQRLGQQDIARRTPASGWRRPRNRGREAAGVVGLGGNGVGPGQVGGGDPQVGVGGQGLLRPGRSAPGRHRASTSPPARGPG
jgi:hypothetical protein